MARRIVNRKLYRRLVGSISSGKGCRQKNDWSKQPPLENNPATEPCRNTHLLFQPFKEGLAVPPKCPQIQARKISSIMLDIFEALEASESFPGCRERSRPRMRKASDTVAYRHVENMGPQHCRLPAALTAGLLKPNQESVCLIFKFRRTSLTRAPKDRVNARILIWPIVYDMLYMVYYAASNLQRSHKT